MAARQNAKKVSAQAPAKKTAAKKTARKAAAAGTRPASSAKPAAKRTAAKKTPVAGTKSAASKKSSAAAGARRASSAKVSAKVSAKASAKPAPKKAAGLKGIQGAKAARIARIVAESFRPAGATHASPRKAAPAPQPAPDETLRVAHRIAAELFAKKAEDVVLMDLRNLSTVADYYLIATCRNEPQMRAILGGAQRALSREGVRSLRAEYMPGVRWAVVDFGDIILHLFEKQTRGFYSLERLWADAPSTTLRAEDYAPVNDAGEAGDGDKTAAGSHDDL